MLAIEEQYFVDELLSWHSINVRQLPWKRGRDAYRIWLSEIILQQTRIAQGLPYYNRIIQTFPTIFDLADSTEDELLKLWEGLGYYSRARNLLHTAREVVTEYNGVIPSDYNDLIKLKGIGPYTAAAITSFAYGKAHAVLDGNVTRVLSRYYGIEARVDSKKGEALFREKAQRLIPLRYPDLFNQAIMDLGALVCRSASPLCRQCPLSKHCIAFNEGRIHILPVKKPVRPKRDRFFTYLVLSENEKIWIRKRNTKDIWKGLYEFFLIEGYWTAPFNELVDIIGFEGFFQGESGPFSQLLSHQRIHARFIEAEILSSRNLTGEFLAVNKNELSNYPFPKIINLYYLNLSF